MRVHLLRRRPSTTEGVVLTRENADAAASWCGGWHISHFGVGMDLDTGGTGHAQYGDWILRGPNGFFYPAPQSAVEALYDGLLT